MIEEVIKDNSTVIREISEEVDRILIPVTLDHNQDNHQQVGNL